MVDRGDVNPEVVSDLIKKESGKGKNATVGGLLLTLKQLGDAINGIDIAFIARRNGNFLQMQCTRNELNF